LFYTFFVKKTTTIARTDDCSFELSESI